MAVVPEICGVLMTPVAIECDLPGAYGTRIHGLAAGSRVRIIFDPELPQMVTNEDANELADLITDVMSQYDA